MTLMWSKKVSAEISARVKKTMASVFDLNETSISENSTPHSTQNWNSMNHVKLMISLEKEFGIELDEIDAASMISYQIIVATIASKSE